MQATGDLFEREIGHAEQLQRALAALERELERARQLVGRSAGPARAKAFRRLAARGFAEATLEDLWGFAEEA